MPLRGNVPTRVRKLAENAGVDAIVLAGAGLFLPRAFGNTSFGTRLPQPFDARWVFGGVTFNANDIFTMIVVPLCLLALAIFLQRSTVGIAIVGAAERAAGELYLGLAGHGLLLLQTEDGETDEARKLIQAGIHDTAAITRPYALPPGTPRDRVQNLRRAFRDTMKDKDFLAEAAKSKLDVDPVSLL